MLLCCCAISAQSFPSASQSGDDRNDNGYDPFSRSPIEKMRSRLRIKAEEKEYKENLDRAQEAVKISKELVKIYETSKTLSKSDRKKLERLEKLIKRVRNASGGDDDDAKVTTQSTETLDLLKSIADHTAKLNDEFKKTTRTVISASVIESANLVLDLIRIVRELPA